MTAPWYFDVISPFAYLFLRLVEREGPGIELVARPLVFAGLLKASGNKGPAEIPAKRRFTYEYCTWFGAHHGIPFVMPAAHPFNPIRYLRLIVAAGSSPTVIRETFSLLWTTGEDPEDDRVWERHCARVGLPDAAAAIADPAVKAQLRSNGEEAIAAGVFGVPSVVVDGRIFWGMDALPMLRDYLADPRKFESAAMQRVPGVRFAAER